MFLNVCFPLIKAGSLSLSKYWTNNGPSSTISQPHLQNTRHAVEALCCSFFQLQSFLRAAQQQAVVLGIMAEVRQLAPHLQLHHGIRPAALGRHAHQLKVMREIEKEERVKEKMATEGKGEGKEGKGIIEKGKDSKQKG